MASKTELINLFEENHGVVGNLCLITGRYSKVVEITTATKILGSQETAKLVAFQVNSGYDSYGKSKGYNAPISEEAEFAYTTALNHLLRSDSHNKFMVGSRTYLFWASSNSASAFPPAAFAFFAHSRLFSRFSSLFSSVWDRRR